MRHSSPMGAVRVLEPMAAACCDAPRRRFGPEVLSKLRRLQPFLGLAAIAVVTLVIIAVPPAETASIGPVSVAVSDPGAGNLATAAPAESGAFDPVPNPYPSRAVAIAETFLFMVNRGEADAVFDLLLDGVTRPGTGSAQYPTLPTDAGFWIDGVLDRSAVEAFVLHASSQSGSIEVADCESVAGGVTTTLVGCTYSNSGGSDARAGHEPATGRLYVVTMDHKVAGMIAFRDPIDASGQTSTDALGRRPVSSSLPMLSRIAAE